MRPRPDLRRVALLTNAVRVCHRGRCHVSVNSLTGCSVVLTPTKTGLLIRRRLAASRGRPTSEQGRGHTLGCHQRSKSHGVMAGLLCSRWGRDGTGVTTCTAYCTMQYAVDWTRLDAVAVAGAKAGHQSTGAQKQVPCVSWTIGPVIGTGIRSRMFRPVGGITLQPSRESRRLRAGEMVGICYCLAVADGGRGLRSE